MVKHTNLKIDLGIDRTSFNKIDQKDRSLLFSLLNSAPMATLVMLPDTSIKYVNHAFEKLIGYSARELIGVKFPYPYTIPENKANTKEKLLKRLQRLTKKVNEEFRKKDGNKISVEINSRPIKRKGEIKYYITNFIDLTQRKRAVKALRDSEKFNSSLLYYSPNPILVLNPDSSIKYVNPALKQLTGFSSNELLGKMSPYPWSMEESKNDINEFNSISSKFEKNVERMIRRKNGEPIWVQTTSTPIIVGGEFQYRISNWVNITDRKNIENKLKKYSQQLKDFSDHVENLREEDRLRISRELHDELGQSLTFLKMEISWLRNHLSEDHQLLTRKVVLMLEQVDLTLQNVKRICTELRPRVLDIIGLASAIEWLIREFQNSTHINCKGKINLGDLNLDQKISTTIFRICQEALTNILRHSNANVVSILLTKKENEIILIVTDNGVGITEKEIDDPRSFGLIGMRERVTNMKGVFTITGSKDMGTKVEVRIPY